MSDPRSRLPGVDRLLEAPASAELLSQHPRSRVVLALREAVRAVRDRIGSGGWEGDPGDVAPYLREARAWLARDARPSLNPVLNATGVVLHTNLGRAPLAVEALEAARRVAGGYSNLEYDLASGRRGSRYTHCAGLLAELTGAEDGLVVNNCAAGLVLGLAALARGRDVVVSRSELVEIGGGFRIPDMLRQAGARLREVGATNRTRLEDYDAAIRAGGVGAILKVHRSNFRISGFTEEADLPSLASLGGERAVPVLYDLGSGLLSDPAALGLPPEPRPQDGVREGADVVVFSGDKLLGGPQSGLVVGRGEAVGALRSHPLCRAFRVDKGTLAALEATLRLHRDGNQALRRIPVLARLAETMEALRGRAESLADALRTRTPGAAEVASGRREGRVGGGTFPGHPVPSWGVSVRPSDGDVDGFARRLREGDPAVVGRVEEDAWWMDLRTIDPGKDGPLLDAVAEALESRPRGGEGGPR